MQIEHKPITTIFRDARKIAEKTNNHLLNTNELNQAVKDKELVKIMTKEMDDDIFLSGTSITYEKNSEWATIKSHKGKSVRIKVPEYQETPLSDVLRTKDGKKFLTTLFGTEKVKQLLDNFNEDLNKVVWTMPIEDRENDQERAVRLYFAWGRFVVSANDWFCSNGYSHRVLSESAKQSKSKVQYSQEEIEEHIDTGNPEIAIAKMMYNARYHKK